MQWFTDYTPQLNRIEGKIDRLTTLVLGLTSKLLVGHPTTRLRVDLEQASIYSKQGKLIMSGSANVTTDHDLKVPLVWKDDVGTVSAPTSGTTATSDTPAVATVDVGTDDLEIFVRSVAVGTANITVTNGSLTDTIQVNVTAPAATSLDVDATDAVLVPKGTTA